MYYDLKLFPYHASEIISRKSIKDRIDWPLQTLNIGGVWKSTEGEGVKVAILDTGYSRRHPDLQNAVVKYQDFSGDGIEDADGHGTHCAGLVGARANDIGVVGIAPKCELMVGKVLNNQGWGQADWIADGIRWAAANGADIISMSLGSKTQMKAVKLALQKLPENVYVVAAAGNSGPKTGTVCYPARYGMVVSVGAISRSKKVPYWSSRGGGVNLVAPGDDILSCFPVRALAKMSGTSMACPIVAGVMALALSKHRLHGGATPITNRKQMLEHLIKACVDLGKKGKDSSYGYGLIDPSKLMAD